LWLWQSTVHSAWAMERSRSESCDERLTNKKAR